MNDRERRISLSLMEKGWRVLRNGAPDFFCIRVSNGKRELIAVEVKGPGDRLSAAQQEVKSFLAEAGIPTYVVGDEDSLDDLQACILERPSLPAVGKVPSRHTGAGLQLDWRSKKKRNREEGQDLNFLQSLGAKILKARP
jgi:hypothetical protein